MVTPWDHKPFRSTHPDGESEAGALPGEGRQQLKLLLVATRQHLASPDLRTLVNTLQSEDNGFDVSLEVSDPARHPELL